MLKKLFISTAYCIGLLFWISCANVSAPQGGPKDLLPPVVLSAKPENGSTLITPDRIVLTFNEFIVLNDVFNQVIVSPPLDNQPVIRTKGKTVVIELSDTLKSDVTYTINFGEAIKDLNESNKLQNYTFAFSTGAILDSLEFSGTVTRSSNLKKEEGVLAMLYPQTEDSTVFVNKPWYFAQTAADGSFSIGNIKAGTYKVFALKDQNFNYIYDLPNEEIAFMDSLIVIDTNAQKVDLQLFLESPDSTKLLEAKSLRYGKVRFVFNKEISSHQFSLLTDIGDLYWETAETQDTVWLWYNNTPADSLVYIHTAEKQIRKTIKLSAESIDSIRANRKFILETNLPAQPLKKGVEEKDVAPVLFDLGKKLRIDVSNPVLSIDGSRFSLYEDSTLINAELSAVGDDSLFRKIEIDYILKAGKLYELRIDSGALTDFYGLTSRPESWSFKTRKDDYYGGLGMSVFVEDSVSCILQIIDASERVIRTSQFTGGQKKLIKHKYIQPGKYSFRLIYDINDNGKWDPGDYLKHKQPEQVLLYEQTADLRPNWEVDYEWIVESP